MNDELYRLVKKHAGEQGLTLRELIERALRNLLQGRNPSDNKYKLKWRTEHGRLLPGVRLDDRDALFDLMEGRD